ncbi:MAG: TIGR00725 family protein [Chloroflexi bacterium]|nr:TIGR00725 family protein [Chloroflexota bacterium]
MPLGRARCYNPVGFFVGGPVKGSAAMVIGVVGGSECTPEEARLAEEVGNELAQRGAILICGGGPGVMEAACRGARKAGGRTIGVLPGGQADEANPYVDVPIVTGMGVARNVIIVKSSRAIIAVDGEFGTLSEIAHALDLGVPVVGLQTWSLSKRGRVDRSIIPAQDAKEAVALALAASGIPEKSSGNLRRQR